MNGKATVANDAQGMFPTSFDVRFDTALLKAGDSLPTSTVRKGGPAANVTPSVTGVFKGNGKEAKLAYVSALWREPFSDKTGMALVFTEKDHSKEKKPDTGALFGKFGSALIISIHEDGGIYGCQVVHSAHQKQGFSSIGSIEATDFTYADGRVEGELTTNGEVDTFGEKWEVKIKFLAPLGETPKEFQVAESKKPAKETKPATSDPDDYDDDADDTEPSANGSGRETGEAIGGCRIQSQGSCSHERCDRRGIQGTRGTACVQNQSGREERLHGTRCQTEGAGLDERRPRHGQSAVLDPEAEAR